MAYGTQLGEALLSHTIALEAELRRQRAEVQALRADIERLRAGPWIGRCQACSHEHESPRHAPAADDVVRAKARAEDPGGEDLCRWSFERGWRCAEDAHRITPSAGA